MILAEIVERTPGELWKEFMKEFRKELLEKFWMLSLRNRWKELLEKSQKGFLDEFQVKIFFGNLRRKSRNKCFEEFQKKEVISEGFSGTSPKGNSPASHNLNYTLLNGCNIMNSFTLSMGSRSYCSWSSFNTNDMYQISSGTLVQHYDNDVPSGFKKSQLNSVSQDHTLGSWPDPARHRIVVNFRI